MSEDFPAAYFITFTCYGVRLHGDRRGTVDKLNNIYGAPMLQSNSIREAYASSTLNNTAYKLSQVARREVLLAIIEVCAYRQWHLYCAHVRSNHVHMVIAAKGVKPETVMATMKAYSSRRLNDSGVDDVAKKRWTRHGSTRYLKGGFNLVAAIKYVMEDQGRKMACYVAPEYASGDYFSGFDDYLFDPI